jgi:hypothetical protein
VSKLFRDGEGAIVDVFGVVHQYHTWSTDNGSYQYTDCGSPLSPDSLGLWSRLSADRYDTYLTCIACVADRRYRP